MTAKELSQLYYLNKEIEQDKYRLAELEAAATNISVKVTGLPHVSGIGNKTALAVEIADLKEIIEIKNRQCIIEYNRLMRYVNSIDDSLMRQIVTLRHINGLSWRQVALHVGGGNTEISVRVAYKRFVDKSCNECNARE